MALFTMGNLTYQRRIGNVRMRGFKDSAGHRRKPPGCGLIDERMDEQRGATVPSVVLLWMEGASLRYSTEEAA